MKTIATMQKQATKTVYFVRHGQSEGNATPVFQALDSPLSKKGKEQAEYMAERASRLSFETIVASPLTRAKETAEIIAEKTKKKVEFSDLFVERIKPTKLMGRAYGDPEAEGLYTDWRTSLFTTGKRVQDGENYDDIVARAKKALEYIEQRPERELLVVAHGIFLRTILAYVLLGDAITDRGFEHFQEHIEMENTGLTILKYGESRQGLSWKLWVWGDHAHLG